MSYRVSGEPVAARPEPTDEQLANFVVVMTFGPGANDTQRKTTLDLLQRSPWLKTEWLHRHAEVQKAADDLAAGRGPGQT